MEINSLRVCNLEWLDRHAFKFLGDTGNHARWSCVCLWCWRRWFLRTCICVIKRPVTNVLRIKLLAPISHAGRTCCNSANASCGGCVADGSNMVVVCSANITLLRVLFAERTTTNKDSQPLSEQWQLLSCLPSPLDKLMTNKEVM